VTDFERVPWAAVFGNARPVEVEIGPGRGDVLFAAAAARPAHDFFAIERTWGIVDALLERAVSLGLPNVRGVAADARCVVARLVPDASVTAYHVYFPDPWPKTRHRRRRLVDADFAAHLRRTLVPGGVVHVASDLPAVVALYVARLGAAGLVPLPAAPDGARPTTHFERRYAGAGTHAARFGLPEGPRSAAVPSAVPGP